MESSVHRWFRTLLFEWGRAWNEADSALRIDLANSLCYLLPPLQGELYVSRVANPPVQVAVLLLLRNPERPHGELRILESCDSEPWFGDAPENNWAMQAARTLLSNIQANWLPDRQDSLPLYRAVCMQRMDDAVPCTSWLVPGDITQIDVLGLIGEQIERRVNRPQPAARIEDQRPHISQLHSTREPVSTTRWLTINARNLAAALGIMQPFWCGLFLSRKAVLDSSLQGDVDFLAGPLELEVNETEWRDRLDAECRRHHIGVPRSLVIQRCTLKAAEDGLLLWPPRLNRLAACEVKASWFDAEARTWHASHRREGSRVKGQLKLLLRFGLDRVGFLHLGATKPRVVESINPWFLAGHDAEVARKALPFVFAPEELPECGYFQAVIGSVPFACEDRSGAGGSLMIQQQSQALALPVQNWREGLLKRLAELPRPRSLEAFISECPTCNQWQFTSVSGAGPCLRCGRVSNDGEYLLPSERQ